jgi:phosphohistidine phosphatase SixA
MRPHLFMLCCAALLTLACNDRTSDSTISTGDMDAADQTTTPGADMSTPDLDAASDLDAAPDDADLDTADADDAGDAGEDLAVQPGQLAVTLERATVQLSWTIPPAATLVLRRKLNAPVAGADDADAALLIEGADPGSLAHATSDLLPDMPDAPRTYHYALFACDQAGTCALAAPQATLTLSLTQALQGGGYNLIWRHATASSCADRTDLGTAATTSTPDWWRSCTAECGSATARQLTEPAASAELAAVRDFMAQQTIPFGRTLSSEFCRCFKTAEGFDLGPNVELDRKLTFFVHDEAQRCINTYLLLNTPTPADTNVAMVGHAGFTCPTLDALAWGEAAVFKPTAQGEPLLVARVLASDWASLQ